jgi:hypothetical protein
MSIISNLFRLIAGGADPIKSTEIAIAQIDQWGASVIAKAPASVQADITAAVTDLKGVASAAVGVADTLAVPIIQTAATAAGAAFSGAVTAYLGPVAGAAITPAALDAIGSIKQGIINELNALELEIQAKLAPVVVASAPVPNPPAAPNP